MTRRLAVLAFVVACGSGDGAPAPPGCGDGVIQADEDCDDGAANRDDSPGACRTDCRAPRCGDGVVDGAEACDDGNGVGGDGCFACGLEVGDPEREPNDSWDGAAPWAGGPVSGSLPAGDRDCFAVDVADCGAVHATVTGCSGGVVLSLHDGVGAQVAGGAAAADSCAVLDPAGEPGARHLDAGRWAVCLAGLFGSDVPAYTLDIQTSDSVGWPTPAGQDPDGDGLPDGCDDDDDGDGIDDPEDNCPDHPNGPDAAPPAPSADGFLRHWLTAAPFTGTDSPDECAPSLDELLGDDAGAVPTFGDPAGENTWLIDISPADRIDFLPRYGGVEAPREVYAATYVDSPVARAPTLALGLDDGARIWLNGVEVLEIASCQGTGVDDFQVPVTLDAGRNRLVIKVRDQGGGWGMFVRFLDDGAPVTDLELSLDPDGPWQPDQSDRDGDGIGDVCDPDP